MNKKRVLAMLLAGAMALSMTACGGGNSASTDDSSNDGGASASGGSYKGQRYPEDSGCRVLAVCKVGR